ncbi:GntR family transcriptional regulator [Bordetella genomosp. 13]|uniref:GntR family transcriptional regulator n=1 Tax=Bordetella genomosp. 13 TaxID=463040 RepID=UPI00119CC43F|nr:GntR family transcriptional regulator [Bordetella genomosp. 13]
MSTAVKQDRDASADKVGAAVYEALRAKAITHAFLPGERLNEGELANELHVSRTPLREALHRLTSEGFLRSIAGKGFFFRELDPKELFDLYELRMALELAAVQLAVERATDQQIDALADMLSEGEASHECATTELIAQDEQFHERLVALAGNAEMSRVLSNINARIQFVRWIDVGQPGRRATHQGHNAIVAALKNRDVDTCAALLRKHIGRRQDEIIEAAHARMVQLFTERASRQRR